MAVLIDTSVLIDAERRRDPSLYRSIGGEQVTMSVITVSELLHGVHRAKSDAARTRRQAFVERLIAEVDPLPVTPQIARIHAGIWADLESDGNLIDTHDLWIAATALAHGLQVATANTRDFARVPGLPVMAL
ncbi:MAG TPA: PIN domain-containing protein [Solirubrobacterales bacterium]